MYTFIQIYNFFCFGWFFSKLRETFSFQHWMMYNMHNNNNDNNNECQKFPKETFFRDFNKHYLKINLLLWKKLYCIQQLWCTAKLYKFYVIYLVLTKEMAQKWHLWQELIKSTSKIWKPSYDWMTWCKQHSATSII